MELRVEQEKNPTPMRVVELPALSHTIKSAGREELLSLLSQARVSIGHWNGRRIQVEGYKGQMTFSEVAAQLEHHYLAIVEPMQLRQQRYEKESTSGIDPMPVKGKGGMFLNLLLLPVTLPLKAIADAVCWATTPYPEVSRLEEKKIDSALKWRNLMDNQLDSLFEKSQNELDRWSSISWAGSIVRVWDAFLDQNSGWRNGYGQDAKVLETMVENRKQREKMQPNLKSPEESLKTAARSLDELLTWSKFRSV